MLAKSSMTPWFARGARGVDEGQQVVHAVVALALAQHQLAGLVVAGDEEGLEVAGRGAAAQIDGAVQGDDVAYLAAVDEVQRLIELGLLPTNSILMPASLTM